MKIKLLLSLLCLSTSVAFAHGSSLTKSDNEALSWIIVLDKNEITAGKETLKKSKNADDRKFAELMIKDHTKNLHEALKMNSKLEKSPAETDAFKKLKEEGQALMAKLKGLKGKEYDTAYMEAMVKGHANALETIDGEFINHVDSKTVKTFVEDTRMHVNHHLQEAKRILGK